MRMLRGTRVIAAPTNIVAEPLFPVILIIGDLSRLILGHYADFTHKVGSCDDDC